MATNNFKPFATAENANVTAQADWEALPALLSGFTAGKASSAQVNKAIRQATFIAAALAQYTANKSGLDVLDDGDLNGFISKMGTAFGKDFQALDATLSALAGLATGANKLPYFTGNDTAAQTDLTSVGRDIIGKNTIADILTYLGLGTAAKKNIGTGSGQVPDMSSFTSSFAKNGYQKLPSGLIIQWGYSNVDSTAAGASADTTVTVTYPVAFPNATAQVLAAYDNTSTLIKAIFATDTFTKTTFQASSFALTYTAATPTYGPRNTAFRWIAIGY